MSNFFSLATIIILLASQLRVSIIIANFYLNREAITKEFCVNLPKGDTTCQGKCHLKRTLGKEKKKEAAHPEIIVEERVPLFFQVQDFSNKEQLTFGDKANTLYVLIYDFEYINSTFHPPEGIVS